MIDQIDDWADRECGGSRSEAIRRLVERGLAAPDKAPRKR
jgi:metal-responsive CopG/Arc/MetJ family transcriptional regulator